MKRLLATGVAAALALLMPSPASAAVCFQNDDSERYVVVCIFGDPCDVSVGGSLIRTICL